MYNKLTTGKCNLDHPYVGFADDTRHYKNNLRKRILKYLLEVIKNSVRIWYELLYFVKGQLEMDKNAWYIIEWEYDTKDFPNIKEQNHSIEFLNLKG